MLITGEKPSLMNLGWLTMIDSNPNLNLWRVCQKDFHLSLPNHVSKSIWWTLYPSIVLVKRGYQLSWICSHFFSNIPLIWKICSHDLTCKKTVRGIFLIVFSNILDDIGDLLFLPFHPSISGHWLLGTWSRIHVKVNGNCYYKIFILCGAKRSLYEYCLIMSTKMAIG